MLVGRFFRFVLVGGLATGIQYGLLILLVAASGMGPVLASAVGFVISAVANYYINYHFTFRSNQSHAAALTKFTVLATVGLAINSAIMSGLVRIGVHYIAAQVVATVVVLLWNFAGNHWWTFRVTPDTADLHPTRRSTWIADFFARIPALVWVVLFAACAQGLRWPSSDALPGGLLSNAAALWRMLWGEHPEPAFSLDRVFQGSMSWAAAHAATMPGAATTAAGVLPVIPFFHLIRRCFGLRPAVIAGCYLAIYQSYLSLSQASIAASLFIFLALWGIDVFLGELQPRQPKVGRLLFSGTLVTVAGLFGAQPWPLSAAIGGYLLLFRNTRRYIVPFVCLVTTSLVLALMLRHSAIGGGGESIASLQSPAASMLRDAGLFLHSPGPAICALAVAGLYWTVKRQIRCDLAVIAALLVSAASLLSVLWPQIGGLPEYWVLSGILMLSYSAVATAELRGGSIGRPGAVAIILLFTIAVQAAG